MEEPVKLMCNLHIQANAPISSSSKMSLSLRSVVRLSVLSRHLVRFTSSDNHQSHPDEQQQGNTSPVSSQHVDVNGTSIHYDQAGNGKHVVLLMPGALGSSVTDFMPQMTHLNRGMFTLVAWDPPGYGKSRPPERDFSGNYLSRDAEYAAKFMQTLDFTRYSLVGWSDGGITALMLAARYPERVRSMVAFGCNSYVTEEEAVMFGGDMKSIDNWSPRMRKPFEDMYGEQLFRKLWAEFCDAYVDFYKKDGGEICDNELADIKCPTLLIHGKKDPIVAAEHPYHLEKKIKGAKLHIMEEGKHNLHLRYFREFNSMVEHFLLQH